MPPGSGPGVTLGIEVELDERSQTSVQQELADLAKGLEGGKDGKDVFKRLAGGIDSLRGSLKSVLDLSKEFGRQWADNLKSLEKQRDLLASIKASGGGGGNGSGGSGPLGEGDDLTEQPNDPHPRRRWNSTAAVFQTGIGAFRTMERGGFANSALYHAAAEVAGSQALSRLLGAWGPVAAGGLNYFGELERQAEDYGEQRLQVFRHGGRGAREAFTRMTNRSSFSPNTLQDDLYLTRPETQRLVMALSKQTGNTRGLETAMKMEAGFGLGNESAQFLGLMKRGGGASGQERRELGQVIGLYLAEGLDRGRVGETFQMMGRLIQNTATGNVDLNRSARTAEFIGTSGERYRGMTPASQAMAGALEGMASGAGGPAAKMFALQAAGLGAGKSYFEAELAISRGMDRQGGVTAESVVKRYAELASVRRAWMEGGEPGRAKAAWLVSQFSGQPQAIVYDILNRYYGGGFRDPVTPDVQRKIDDALDKTTAHGTDLEKRSAELSKERTWFENNEPLMDQTRPGTHSELGVGVGNRSLIQKNATGYLEGGEATSPGSGSVDFRDNYGQLRAHAPAKDESGNASYSGGSYAHKGQDITMPPGSEVRVPCDGEVRAIFQAMRGDPIYGWGLEFRGTNGVTYRFLHLDQRPPFKQGDRLKAGTSIGVTARHNFRGSKSHLHLETGKRSGGRFVPMDPGTYSRPGAVSREQFQYMLPAMQPQQAEASAGTAPAASDHVAPAAAPQASPDRHVLPAVEISVHDSRVNVTRKAAGQGVTGTGLQGRRAL